MASKTKMNVMERTTVNRALGQGATYSTFCEGIDFMAPANLRKVYDSPEDSEHRKFNRVKGTRNWIAVSDYDSFESFSDKVHDLLNKPRVFCHVEVIYSGNSRGGNLFPGYSVYKKLDLSFFFKAAFDEKELRAHYDRLKSATGHGCIRIDASSCFDFYYIEHLIQLYVEKKVVGKDCQVLTRVDCEIEKIFLSNHTQSVSRYLTRVNPFGRKSLTVEYEGLADQVTPTNILCALGPQLMELKKESSDDMKLQSVMEMM